MTVVHSKRTIAMCNGTRITKTEGEGSLFTWSGDCRKAIEGPSERGSGVRGRIGGSACRHRRKAFEHRERGSPRACCTSESATVSDSLTVSGPQENNAKYVLFRCRASWCRHRPRFLSGLHSRTGGGAFRSLPLTRSLYPLPVVAKCRSPGRTYAARSRRGLGPEGQLPDAGPLIDAVENLRACDEPHLRYGFVAHLLVAGYESAEVLGHASVETTMTHTLLLNKSGLGVRSPLDEV